MNPPHAEEGSDESPIHDTDVPVLDAVAADENIPQLPVAQGINPVVVLRIIRHFISDNLDDNKKAWKQGTVAVYAYLCDVLEIDRSAIDLKTKSAKQKLFDLVSFRLRFSLVF